MAEALRRAADDSGVGRRRCSPAPTRSASSSLLSWRYRDPARSSPSGVGAAPAHRPPSRAWAATARRSLVNLAASRSRPARPTSSLLGGAEAWRTRMGRAGGGRGPGLDRAGRRRARGDRSSTAEVPMSAPGEQARGVVMPVQVYPLFEQALRIRRGRGLDEHLDRDRPSCGRASARWRPPTRTPGSRRPTPPRRSARPAPDNRMIGFPYTKRMNSNNAVEQGAARDPVLGRAGRGARRAAATAGCSRTAAPTPTTTTSSPSATTSASSPAMRLGRAAAPSSWPASASTTSPTSTSTRASRRRCRSRPASSGSGSTGRSTVTGGLSFAGGPWNNYVMHSIATMAGLLRDDPAPSASCTANGGYITKHAFGVYSTEPPADGVPPRRAAGRGRRPPPPRARRGPDGAVAVETWTVMHDRDGNPETGIVVGAARRRPPGPGARRTDADLLKALVTEDLGRPPRPTSARRTARSRSPERAGRAARSLLRGAGADRSRRQARRCTSGRRGISSSERLERRDVEGEQPHRRLRRDAGVAGLVTDQRHLAHDATRADRRDVLPAGEDARLALEHEEALDARRRPGRSSTAPGSASTGSPRAATRASSASVIWANSAM